MAIYHAWGCYIYIYERAAYDATTTTTLPRCFLALLLCNMSSLNVNSNLSLYNDKCKWNVRRISEPPSSRALFHTHLHDIAHRVAAAPLASFHVHTHSALQCDNISQNIKHNIFKRFCFFLLSKRICIICSDILVMSVPWPTAKGALFDKYNKKHLKQTES